MNARCYLVALWLACSSATLVAQQARRASAEARGGPAIVAPRVLVELESGPANLGVAAHGDLDGDGDVDLLTLERPDLGHEPTGVQVWLNDGRANFQFLSRVAFSPWSSGFRVASQVFLADVTGNGWPDLVYDRYRGLSAIPSGVLVHEGLGDGTFGPGFLLPLEVEGDPPLRLTAMDLGRDGVADAVAGTWNGYGAIQVFRTVDGSPTRQAILPLPAEFRSIGQRQHTGDIDGDGHEDVLVVLAASATAPIRLQPFLGGPSGFSALTPQALSSPTIARACWSTGTGMETPTT